MAGQTKRCGTREQRKANAIERGNQERESMKLYKLTDQEGYTRKGQKGETKWFEGLTVVVVKAKRRKLPQLCSASVVHAYSNLNLGLLLNPIHASIKNPVLWEAEGNVVISDWGKVGCDCLTIVRELPLPEWYTDEKRRTRVQIAFAILCAEQVLPLYEKQCPTDDRDRPRKAIQAAIDYLVEGKEVAGAAYAASVAADTAVYAAYTTAAAARVTNTISQINFEELADRAITESNVE